MKPEFTLTFAFHPMDLGPLMSERYSGESY
jgi:hypothetical protein